ncbi:unnamed protein product, partial [Arabidopsis halleri]
MDVVPHIDLKFVGDVLAIIIADGRENLPILNPGVGYGLTKPPLRGSSSITISPSRLQRYSKDNRHHEWPTYRLIPEDVKRRWFKLLARKYTWDPMHTSTVWTQFNLVARTIFRDQMRAFMRIWARSGDKPDWVFKSKTDKNPNRRFFGCRLYKEGGNAHRKFFRWLDEEVIGWPKRALVEAQSVIKEKTERIEELYA